jgi:PIN domain nuclease of toxin-antitoxin system
VVACRRPLADEAAERIGDPATRVVVSAASIWEAAIKAALGRLDIPASLTQAAADEGFAALASTFDHAERAAPLPPHHRDPFDRMLVAHAQAEELRLVRRDQVFAAYDVDVLRC